jgi:murein DD-endopeptidase MepM/ murein hydrolase activator NlpD
MIKKHYLVNILGFLIFVWFSWYAYGYFFDQTIPQVQIIGVQNDGYYCGDIPCVVSGNKSGELSVWFDNKRLVDTMRLKNKNQDYPVLIPANDVGDGKHEVRFSFIDHTYNRNNLSQTIKINTDNKVLQVNMHNLDTEVRILQGRTMHMVFDVNKPIKNAQVTVFSRYYPCFAQSKNSFIYEAFIPVACEERAGQYTLALHVTDNLGVTRQLEKNFEVVKYPFKKQYLRVESEKIAQENELGRESKELERVISQLTESSVQKKLWRGQFCSPIDIERITCDFGTIRTTQYKGRYAHKAVDMINTPKSVVWAPNHGVIALKERFAVNGNTVILDHGWGILSMICHLDEFADIEVGDLVAQGNPIGTIGKSGYATGYHVHWETRINNVPIDPLQWIEITT